ncbi:UDP-4-amino-4,6-dideoxy-N-acetyl-beta-L-altrosamine N-acetyltransferase [Paenibacillus alginolyticus]|uniref:UDP-4-amino-4, 6-dideoxy-N-acetyl-beta-L-altrosamine N-acetyltransferase n=1 Tax=Paenibacillus alginolyticus TaxID=59839 RepID=UPI000492CA57|nr:UDP-4-amino-4,6-dideoxy-N-acetyl-beta-L-altrosamine N-acetyltransferase [Paenibacillus alginolyticus]MCY9665092.1 UDP-4-amino-4,6-dideoxy-N-acetyl-beta-L-altrosamine N-acetyltransferase [Paenibacillus alginolyticus]
MEPFNEYKLRPMRESDLMIVLQWRNSDRIRINMYSDEIITWENHCAWFSRILNNLAHRYYIFELKQVPIGVVNFTDIGLTHNRCNWGFYLGETDVPRGSGTVMGIHALTEAFEHLNLRKVCAEVFAYNEASLRYHTRLGFTQEGYLERHVWKNSKYEDLVLFACFSDQWYAIKEKLLSRFT